MRIQINKENTAYIKDPFNRYNYFVGYICPSCGTELFGLWFTNRRKNYAPDFPKEAKDEQKAICNLKACPVCDGELNKSDKTHPGDALYSWPIWFTGFQKQKEPIFIDPSGNGYIYGFSNMSVPNTRKHVQRAIDYLFGKARECIQDGYKSQAATRIANDLEFWNSSKDMIEKRIDPLTIKGSPESLKNHIMQLLQLEANIYTLKQHLEVLYFNEIQVNKSIEEEHFSKLAQCKQRIYDLTMQDIKPEENRIIIPELPEEPTSPVYKTYNIFNKRKIEAENEVLKKEYEAKLQKYQEKKKVYLQAKECWQEENHRLYQEAKERHDKAILGAQKEFKDLKETGLLINVPESEIKQLIANEIQQAKELIVSAIKTKNALYSMGIIYEKYQNPVALSTFYEYLASGRCDSLEGTNGAYNIYEAEIRADRIISQLDDVLNSLDQIKQNQHMIYAAIVSMNSELTSLNSKMRDAVGVLGSIKDDTSSISNNSKVIAYNTASTAYYAKRQTALTDALGYLVALH